jgi:type IV pilus assembly protein PilN
MRVTINLATRPFADLGPILKRLRIAMAVLALLAIGLGLGVRALDSKAEKARESERAIDVSIAKLNQEQSGYKTRLALPENAEIVDQTEALNKIIDEKAFSWTLAMEDLETVLPGGVMVTTLEPTVDKKDGHITVRLRVAGARDKAVDLVANLEHSRRFLQPRIVNEAIESSGNGPQQLVPVSLSNPVNFEILADYNPATPEERKAARRKAQAGAENWERKPEAATPTRAMPRSAQPVAPRRPVAPQPGLPRPGVQRPPYTPPPPTAPVTQDSLPTPPSAFTGGPQ